MYRMRCDGTGGRQLQGRLHQRSDLDIAQQVGCAPLMLASAETLRMGYLVALILRTEP